MSSGGKVVSLKTLIFIFSMGGKVDHSVKQMGKLLADVKGGGQGQAISKSEVTVTADSILGPVMDLLDGKGRLIRKTCCLMVRPLRRKKLLKTKKKNIR